MITDPEEVRADPALAALAADLSFHKSFISEEIRDEGRAQRGAEDVLLVLEARGLGVTDEIRERIIACDDPDLTRIWLRRAATTASAAEIFAEADRDA
ncbi:hypothetical protein ABZ490_33525 [Streptomyces sp. NPDC005811]|uniref:hypothetical protein n=1 Tax=Streptomyces sp. NPDC005811 TaxID=3154565 RepID=UPI0033F6E7EE